MSSPGDFGLGPHYRELVIGGTVTDPKTADVLTYNVENDTVTIETLSGDEATVRMEFLALVTSQWAALTADRRASESVPHGRTPAQRTRRGRGQ